MLMSTCEYARHDNAIWRPNFDETRLVIQLLARSLFEIGPQLIRTVQQRNVIRMLEISLTDDTRLAVRAAVGMSAGKPIEPENFGSALPQMKRRRAAYAACADNDDVVSAH